MHRWVNKEESVFSTVCFSLPQCLGIQDKVLFSKLQVYSVISSLLAEVCLSVWGCKIFRNYHKNKDCSNVIAYICRQLFIFLKELACYFKHLFLRTVVGVNSLNLVKRKARFRGRLVHGLYEANKWQSWGRELGSKQETLCMDGGSTVWGSCSGKHSGII